MTHIPRISNRAVLGSIVAICLAGGSVVGAQVWSQNQTGLAWTGNNSGIVKPGQHAPSPAPIPSADSPEPGSPVAVPPLDTTLACAAVPTQPQSTIDASAARSATTATMTGTFALVEANPAATTVVLPSNGLSTRESGGKVAELATLQGAVPLAVLPRLAGRPPVAAQAVVGSVPNAQGGDPAARPSASVAYAADTGDLRGLAAAACSAPVMDQWIVAGETTSGSQSTLVITNPGTTTAQVTVSVYGATGEIPSLGADSYVLAPGAQERVVLGAIAPAERRSVVRVVATGGTVSAVVEHTRLDGLVPRGVAIATAGALPAAVVTIPGVSLAASQPDAPDAGALRLLATEKDTTATISVLGPTGKVVLYGAETVDLVAGTVADVSLAGVPTGNYTIVATANAPMVGAVRIMRTGPAISSTAGSVTVTAGTSADIEWLASRHAEPAADVRGTPEARGAEPAPAASPEVIAVPAGVVPTVVLGFLPSDPAALDSVLADVPVSYSGGDPKSDNRKAAVRALVTAYDPSGAVLETREMSAVLGATIAFSSLASGKDVAAISVAPTAGTNVAWSVILTKPSIVGGIAALQPQPSGAESSVVYVTPADNLGTKN